MNVLGSSLCVWEMFVVYKSSQNEFRVTTNVFNLHPDLNWDVLKLVFEVALSALCESVLCVLYEGNKQQRHSLNKTHNNTFSSVSSVWPTVYKVTKHLPNQKGLITNQYFGIESADCVMIRLLLIDTNSLTSWTADFTDCRV